jgi:hypothetical protein
MTPEIGANSCLGVIIPGPPAPPSNDGRAPGTDPPTPDQVQRYLFARYRNWCWQWWAVGANKIVSEAAERRLANGEDSKVVEAWRKDLER